VSTRLPKKRDRNQLRLGFENERRDGRRWCESCASWVLPDGFDLFHPYSQHPRRPYDTDVGIGGRASKEKKAT
jgi:hypothetical protein